jgi:acetyl-CoA carboxylase biotin carboxyl carrier protein
VNITEIRKLIKLVENSDIAELEVAEGETSIRISRQSSVAPVAMASQTFAPSAPTAIAAPATTAPEATSEPAAENNEHVVNSPMVGTFYRSSSPDADPFVNEGDKIRKGDTLCIIEAMKLMNEIEAEYDGVVDKILVNDATPLEFGQPIFVVTPV